MNQMRQTAIRMAPSDEGLILAMLETGKFRSKSAVVRWGLRCAAAKLREAGYLKGGKDDPTLFIPS